VTALTSLRENPAHQRDAAVRAFRHDLDESEQALLRATNGREGRMDANRMREVARRERDALVARTGRRRGVTRPETARALLAHRHPWFTERLAELLQEAGVDVVAQAANGADAVGIAVAEQPELVLVEDSLLMLPADEAVREIRKYCPHAVIAVRVSGQDRAGLMLEAGADTVLARQLRPEEVVSQVLAARVQLTSRPAGPPSCRSWDFV
jgi:CheY-like chemotaxis protein